jgi:hypothetical protein
MRTYQIEGICKMLAAVNALWNSLGGWIVRVSSKYIQDDVTFHLP